MEVSTNMWHNLGIGDLTLKIKNLFDLVVKVSQIY